MVTIPPPRLFRRVFHDSSSYAALLDRDDANHAAAVAILGDIADTRYRSVTTNIIVIEAHALLSTLGPARARQFLRQMQAGDTLVIRVRASDEAAAHDLLFRYADKAWSLADATSFVVMERLDIRYAFTFDSDFAQYGFTPLTPGLLR